jgi:hypothetical protein
MMVWPAGVGEVLGEIAALVDVAVPVAAAVPDKVTRPGTWP